MNDPEIHNKVPIPIFIQSGFFFSFFLPENEDRDRRRFGINPLNAELNPICHLLALLGTHHILHVSRITVNHPSKGIIIQNAFNSIVFLTWM